MEELLKLLETKIKDLICQLNSLQHSNSELHHGKTKLAQEKESLLHRQKKAVYQIENLVNRLKAIEKLGAS